MTGELRLEAVRGMRDNYQALHCGDVRLGVVEVLADGLYMPLTARNPRTLRGCAVYFAARRLKQATREYVDAKRMVAELALP